MAARAQQGIDLTARSADGRQEVGGESFINIFVPFFIGLFFSIVVLSSGTLPAGSRVTDEKENRTIEVMATSLTPGQLDRRQSDRVDGGGADADRHSGWSRLSSA